jgi:hypothetical protein
MTRSATAFALGARIGVTIRRDPDARSAVNKLRAITMVVVANEISGPCATGRRCDDLSPDPPSRRVPRDVDVDDTPSAMRDEDQRIYRAEREGLHSEQVDRPDRGPVVAQEGAPAL